MSESTKPWDGKPYDYKADAHPCPRFERCGAGYCPLLPGAPTKEDGVCFWLLELVKDGGVERVQALLPMAEVHAALLAFARNVQANPKAYPSPYSDAIANASATPSRIEQGRMKAARHLHPRGTAKNAREAARNLPTVRAAH